MIKTQVKMNTTKTQYPDMTYEEIKEMVKRLNEERKGVKK
jgi:hypothetical protein